MGGLIMVDRSNEQKKEINVHRKRMSKKKIDQYYCSCSADEVEIKVERRGILTYIKPGLISLADLGSFSVPGITRV